MRDRSCARSSSFGRTVRALACATAVAFALLLVHAAAAQPKPFREYEGFEGADSAAPLPDDWQVPGELVIGRLMYPSAARRFPSAAATGDKAARAGPTTTRRATARSCRCCAGSRARTCARSSSP